YARGLHLPDILKACAVVLMLGALLGCAAPSASLIADATSRDATSRDATSRDAFNGVRNADFSARFPTTEGQSQGSSQSPKPLLFPGADVDPELRRDRDPDMRTASFQQAALAQGDGPQQAASLKGDGVEINFDGADVQTVAKFLLGDILQLNFTVD